MASFAFKKNQFVFASVRGYPIWPGKIHDFFKTSKEIQYIVFLYGFNVFMKFRENKLRDYKDYVRKNIDKLFNLLLYIQAIEHAKRDLCCAETLQSTQKTSEIVEMKNCSVKKETFLLEETDEKPFLPLLCRFVEKRENDGSSFDVKTPDLCHNQPIVGEFELLETEIRLLKCDYFIKSNLSTIKTDHKKCLIGLNALQKLRLTSFILKRNPQILQTVAQLRYYHGRMEKWKLKGEERCDFLHYEKKIRIKANKIFHSLQSIILS